MTFTQSDNPSLFFCAVQPRTKFVRWLNQYKTPAFQYLSIPLQGSQFRHKELIKIDRGMRGHYCVICVIFVQRKTVLVERYRCSVIHQPRNVWQSDRHIQPVQHSMTPHFLLIVNWLIAYPDLVLTCMGSHWCFNASIAQLSFTVISRTRTTIALSARQ